jgi:hypothetical protein
VAYPVSGAFVQWLTATKGNDAVKALYGSLKADSSPADNTQARTERGEEGRHRPRLRA